MKGLPSRFKVIGAIVRKDLREFTRDRLWRFLVPISLAAMIAIVLVLPRRVNETISVGISPPEFAASLGAAVAGSAGAASLPGLRIVACADEARLAAAVAGEEGISGTEKAAVGIAFPPDFITAVGSGEKTTVSVYLNASLPEEIGAAVSSGIRELAYALRAVAAGRGPLSAIPVTLPEFRTIVLGEDRAGAQIPLREKIRPLLALLVVLVEAMALAGLVAVEIEHRTMTAMLVTPARTGDVLAAKGLTGIILALSQGIAFLILTGGLGRSWPAVLLMVLLASGMASAVGMIAGSAGRDFMATLFLGLVLIVPLLIPAFAVIFPVGSAPWTKALPSYGLIRGLVDTVGYGKGWGAALPRIAGAAAWTAGLFACALVVLKRKVEVL